MAPSIDRSAIAGSIQGIFRRQKVYSSREARLGLVTGPDASSHINGVE